MEEFTFSSKYKVKKPATSKIEDEGKNEPEEKEQLTHRIPNPPENLSEKAKIPLDTTVKNEPPPKIHQNNQNGVHLKIVCFIILICILIVLVWIYFFASNGNRNSEIENQVGLTEKNKDNEIEQGKDQLKYNNDGMKDDSNSKNAPEKTDGMEDDSNSNKTPNKTISLNHSRENKRKNKLGNNKTNPQNNKNNKKRNRRKGKKNRKNKK